MTARGRWSHAELLARMTPDERAAFLSTLSARQMRMIETLWRWWQRPDQVPPVGKWRTWLVMAGRGFGKTRMGAEWVRAQAEADPRFRIALVGATMADVRRVMVEGESGLIEIAPEMTRPKWEPSLAKLTWPGGAEAYGYSAAEPEGLRGPQHHIAWADEIAKWSEGTKAWDNLALTLRLGRWPRVGTEVQVMAAGVGDGSAPPVAVTALSGASILPPSPVHLRADVSSDGALSLQWVRRSRGGWRWLDSVDAPLGEERELYRVGLESEPVSRGVIDIDQPMLAIAAGDVPSGATAAVVRQIGSYGASPMARVELT